MEQVRGDSEKPADEHITIPLGLQQIAQLPRGSIKRNKWTVDLSKTEFPLLRVVLLQELKWSLVGIEDQRSNTSLFWTDFYTTEEAVKRLKNHQRLNRFPLSAELGKKNSLTQNVQQMGLRFPDQFQFYPKTWLLPQETHGYTEHAQAHPGKYFIVKPYANCQGKGIFLTNSIINPRQQLVVQQYVCNPLLIEGLKFDIRIYVLIRSLNPLVIYVFDEAMVRLATIPYERPTEKNLQNLCMHLTNYAINKSHALYQPNKQIDRTDIGHKRSLSFLLQWLGEQGHDSQSVQRQIDALIIKTVLSAYEKMEPAFAKARLNSEKAQECVCFELIGLDVMLDEQARPILLQVNHMPSLYADTPFDFALKRLVLLDTVSLLRLNNDCLKKSVAYPYREGGFRRIFPPEEPMKEEIASCLTVYKKIHNKLYPVQKRRPKLTSVNSYQIKGKLETPTDSLDKSMNRETHRYGSINSPVTIPFKVSQIRLNLTMDFTTTPTADTLRRTLLEERIQRNARTKSIGGHTTAVGFSSSNPKATIEDTPRIQLTHGKLTQRLRQLKQATLRLCSITKPSVLASLNSQIFGITYRDSKK